MIIACLNGFSRLLAQLNPAGNLSFQKATTVDEIRQLQQEFWKRDGVLFPEDYLKAGSCFLVRNRLGELVGSFAIIHGTEPRTLLQLPENARAQFLNSLKPGERVVETTGVWLKKQRHHFTSAAIFWARMFTETYSDKRTVNVFSCDTRKPNLEKMYRKGSGGIVYRGPIQPLPGMEDNGAQEEVVFFQRRRDCAKGFAREVTRRFGKLVAAAGLTGAATTAAGAPLNSLSLFTFAHNETEACRVSEDPFAIPAQVFGTNSPNAYNREMLSTNNFAPIDVNKCVDQSHYRTALKVDPMDAANYGFDPTSGEIFVANVRGLEKFYVAAIPVNSVAKVIFQINYGEMAPLGFRPNHVQTRIFFAKPVLLAAQWPMTGETTEVNDLVFTGNPVGIDEAARTHPVKSFDGSLLHTRGVQTSERRLLDAFDHGLGNMRQFELALTPEQGSLYIRAFLDKANARRMSDKFILTGLNCASTQFQLLDALFGKPANAKSPYDPAQAFKALQQRNLIVREIQPMQEEPWAVELLKTHQPQ